MDYDSKKQVQLAIPRINSKLRAMGFIHGYAALRIDKTKRGWHIAIILKSHIKPIERVAAEAVLGDDPMRAAMNFARARNAKHMPKFWKQRWNILYDYKLVNK